MNRRGVGIIVLVGSLVILSEKVTWAQVAPERSTAMKQTAERVKAFAERMPESARNMLSSGALNLINLAERWDRIESHLRQARSRPVPRINRSCRLAWKRLWRIGSYHPNRSRTRP